MKTITLPLLVLAYSVNSASAAVKSCYYPDGSLAGDTPCSNSTTGHSSCCSAPCMSSGLCFDNGLISRGSCTDATWKDEACPQFCVDAIPQGGCPIIPRQWTNGVDVANIGWCCDFPTSNGSCAQGFEIKVQAGTVLPPSSTTPSSSSTATSSPTSSSTAAPAASATSCSTNGLNSNTDTTTYPATHDAAIGAGVGLPLGIAALVFVGLWLRERMKRKKVENANQYTQAPQQYSLDMKPQVASPATVYSNTRTMVNPVAVPGTQQPYGELAGTQRYGELA